MHTVQDFGPGPIMTTSRVLLTGGSGLLGTKLQALMPGAGAPDMDVFDVRDPAGMEAYLRAHPADVVLHAGAITSPPAVEEDPLPALDTNIIGTANVVALCVRHGLRLVYISTDYVFSGDDGPYSEEDPVHPVNKYAWSKLGGECAVRLYGNSLIIRTTFGPDEFPYPKAFVDQWTSREGVSAIAAKIAPLVTGDATGVVHVGGPRRTVLEYAKSLDPGKDIGEIRRDEVNFPVPRDVSLNLDRYERLMGAADD